MYIQKHYIMLIVFSKSVNYKLAGKCNLVFRQITTVLLLTKLENYTALFILKNLFPGRLI